MTMVLSESPVDMTALVIPQTPTDQMMGVTGGVMPNFGGSMSDGTVFLNNTSTKQFEDISKFPLEMSSSPNYIFAKILSLDFENKSYKNLNDYLSVNTQSTNELNMNGMVSPNQINFTPDMSINQNANLRAQENFGTPIILVTPEVRFSYPAISQVQNGTPSNSITTPKFGSDVKFVYPRP